MVVDSSPKLTHSDWIKEQSGDSDISLLVQLLKSDRLKKYIAREMDSSGIQDLSKYHKDLFLKNRLLYQRVTLKNHQGPISQFVLPKNFVCKVILACLWFIRFNIALLELGRLSTALYNCSNSSYVIHLKLN